MGQMPRRAVDVTLHIGGDSWEDVREMLSRLMMQADAGRLFNGCSGSPTAGHACTVVLNPEMTHERYVEEVACWIEDERAVAEGGA